SDRRNHGLFTEKDHADLLLGETEHPQAGQFPPPLRERDACTIIDHPYGDDASEEDEHRHRDEKSLLELRLEALDGVAAGSDAGYRGHPLELLEECRPLWLFHAEVGAGDRRAFAHESVQ